MRLPKLTGALSATIICGSCSNSASQISDARPAARAMIEGYFTNVSITSDSATRSSSCADPCASASWGWKVGGTALRGNRLRASTGSRILVAHGARYDYGVGD